MNLFNRHFKEMLEWTEHSIPGAEFWSLKGQVKIPTDWHDFNDDGPTKLFRIDNLEFYYLKIPNNRLLQWMLLWKHLECYHYYGGRSMNNVEYAKCVSFTEI